MASLLIIWTFAVEVILKNPSFIHASVITAFFHHSSQLGSAESDVFSFKSVTSCSRIEVGREVGPSKTRESTMTFGNTSFRSEVSSPATEEREHRADFCGD